MRHLSEETKAVLEELEKGNPPSKDAGLFGASIPVTDARVVLIPVPWDATTSYGSGAAAAPEAIVQASHQLDLMDLAFGSFYWAGITMLPVDHDLKALNAKARGKAKAIIERLETHKPISGNELQVVNEASEKVNDYVYRYAKEFISQDKVVGVIGGDHSSPFGLLKALSETTPFGILHFDAHHDLREAFEDFTHSHASVMFNVLEQCSQVERLVSIGIRDFSRAEFLRAEQDERIRTYYSRSIFSRRARGESFQQICDEIISHLPEQVYVSFDIDGLNPAYCPSTGTPVPGGFSFEEAVHILELLAVSGKKIIGFDLCEVVPGETSEWDANVAARMLYKLCGATAISQKWLEA